MTWVKICGISDEAALEATLDAGADAVGFVFHRPSHRYVSPARARQLARRVAGQALRVGVLVDSHRQAVEEILTQVPLDVLQWAGGPIPPWAEQISSVLHIGVLRLAEGDPLPDDPAPAWAYLLDAVGPPGTYGGSGRPGTWPTARATSGATRLILSGGLSPETVAAVVRRTHPFGVDVSSGVETDRKKDPYKISAFVKAVRQDADGA